MARSPSGESVLTRAVRIFEAFGPDRSVLSLSELSRRADLPLATTARLVDELTRHGLLSRDELRRVCVGTRMWELAERASPVLGLRQAALQSMHDLQAVVGHSTQLGILDSDQVLFVERLAVPGSTPNVTRTAGRLPLHASASGLVLLAHAPADIRDRVVQGPLPGFTEATLREEHALRRALAEVRDRGFAFCPGHIHPDATGIAVPVRTRGRVVAALGLVVPNDDVAWSLIRPLQVAGLHLSRALDTAQVS
ncbi:IclR family transcriptional regulator [Actinocorallia longicatena]|uniref:IclR family transcriptional regulator n=1 Tax=Actinocorallia longicatena TaxID=111803 RepID=A0ABP6Q061_9ACTN